MRPSARQAVDDAWMRVRTSSQLVGASVRTARRHKELLLFPVLSLSMTAALFLAVFVLGPVVVGQAIDLPPKAVLGLLGLLLLLVLYLQQVSATFFNVALTFAAFRALRDEPTSPRAAFAHALARLRPIMTYSAVAIAAGVLVAPLALIPRARAFFGRLFPSLGVAWSVVPLMAIPVLVRERRGGLASIRRAVRLFRERWGETSIAVVSLYLLWLSIAAASVFVFQQLPSNAPGGGAAGVWLGLILVSCATPMLVDSLVSSMYGSALYVFAVEGVVPKAFDTGDLTTVWRVGNASAPGGPQAPGLAGDVRAARGFRWAPVVALAVIMLVIMALGDGPPDPARMLRQARSVWTGSGPGLAVNDRNFPDRLRMVWSREFPDPICGLAVRPDLQVAAAGPVTLAFLDRAGNVIQQFANNVRGDDWASMVGGGDLLVSANLPGITGSSCVVSSKWGHAIRAYDSSGARRWTWRMREGGDAVDDIAAIHVPGQGDLVAVGYNGFGGLCLLDADGGEKWCNKSIGNVSFVTAFDCDRDGRDDILSLSPHSHPYFGSKLGCYSTEGTLVRDLDVPTDPYGLRAFDARGGGRRDLVAWYHDGVLGGALVLAAWTSEGHVLGELRLQTEANPVSAAITAVKLRAGSGSDIAVALPDGWVVGTSLDGERWGHHFAGADGTGLAVTALDLDDDGAQELIVASGRTVSAWTWNGRG